MPFLGANRTALIAGWGPQGPDYFNSETFAMNMDLDATGVVPTYSVQRNEDTFAISNQNFVNTWDAGEVDTSDRTNWDIRASTSIYTLRFPTGFFAADAGNGLENTVWRKVGEFISFSETWGVDIVTGGYIVFSYNSEGVFVSTNLSSNPGTVLATSLEDRWISIILSRGPRTSFSNYDSNAGTDTYGCRVYVRDAITGELLFARDMTSFNGTTNWLDDMPDFVTYSDVITSGESSGQTTLNWRIDGLSSFFDYTGDIDCAQCWWAPGSFIDPAVNSNWIGNSIPTEIAGYTAWIHATFQDVYSTGTPEVTGFTHISCSPTGLVTQPDDIIITAGNEDTQQYAFTNTIYPGS
jgi:hypothetical protein